MNVFKHDLESILGITSDIETFQPKKTSSKFYYLRISLILSIEYRIRSVKSETPHIWTAEPTS